LIVQTLLNAAVLNGSDSTSPRRKIRPTRPYLSGEATPCPADDIVRAIDTGNECRGTHQGWQRDATAEADFEHAIRRLKLELAYGEGIHPCVVTVHHEPDHGSHESVRARKLLCDETGCHRSNP
jgi:hypothetical protein